MGSPASVQQLAAESQKQLDKSTTSVEALKATVTLEKAIAIAFRQKSKNNLGSGCLTRQSKKPPQEVTSSELARLYL